MTGLFAGLMNDGPRPNRYIEYVIVTVLVAYLVNFFIGKSRNAAIADAWVSAVYCVRWSAVTEVLVCR